jgi:hypothetical protein
MQGPRDLSKGVIVILSGGLFDWMNPIEVRTRMDQIITDINTDPWVLANSGGKGLIYHLLEDQHTKHIHQARWQDLCAVPELLAASPLVIIGHSNGGAAAIDLARFLQGRGKPVDLLFSADSVLTLDDNGDPYKVPPNVKLNLNSYSIPVFPIWLTLPFPFGQKNSRQADGSLSGILNIGLPFEEPGALEHRDVFYALAGGDSKADSYTYPELIRDSTLSVLKGATNQDVFQLAGQYLQVLADSARISIDLDGDNLKTTLEPQGQAAIAPTPTLSDAAIADLHQQMMTLEKMRLSMR